MVVININMCDIVKSKDIYDLIRNQIDYEYYPMYSLERQHIQNKIIDEHIKNMDKIKKINQPWLIYMCGCYGSGKTYSLNTLGLFSTNLVIIDPDKIKCMLSVQSPTDIKINNKNTDLMDAKQRLHLESTYVSYIIERLVIINGYNAIIDVSLHNYDWYFDYLNKIKIDNPKYKLCIVKVNCDLATILERCHARSIATGRTIPEPQIIKIFDKLSHAYSILAPIFDGVIEIDNYDKPKITYSNFQSKLPWNN